jgi:two-component system response regulator LytT
MNVLLVDDEPLARNELKYLLNHCEGIGHIEEAGSIQEALEIILLENIDLAFLDIQLTDETGLDLADKLAKVTDPPAIIFATAYDEYAIQAFEKNAKDYILKPFELERVREAVSRVQALTEKQDQQSIDTYSQPKRFPIQAEDRIVMVKMEDILAVEVSNGETSIHTRQQTYTIQEPLTAWENKLDASIFMKVHRSFIISLEAIKEIQPWFNHTYQVTLINNQKVPVSRSYMKDFKQRLGL